MKRLRSLFRQAKLTMDGNYHMRNARLLDRASERADTNVERRILRLAAELCYVRGNLAFLRAAGI